MRQQYLNISKNNDCHLFVTLLVLATAIHVQFAERPSTGGPFKQAQTIIQERLERRHSIAPYDQVFSGRSVREYGNAGK